MAATAAATFGWDKLSPTTKMNKRIIELNNERVAMMGIWGLGTYEIMGVTIMPGVGISRVTELEGARDSWEGIFFFLRDKA